MMLSTSASESPYQVAYTIHPAYIAGECSTISNTILNTIRLKADPFLTIWTHKRHRGPRFPPPVRVTGSLQWHHNGRDIVSNHQPHHPTVYSTVYSDADQRKHQSSASLAFVREIHRGPTDEFPTEMASNAENVSIWWRHHVFFVIAMGIKTWDIKSVLYLCSII